MIKDQNEYLCSLNRNALKELGWDDSSAKIIRQQCRLHKDVIDL